MDVVALCGELLAPNGPSAAALEFAGHPISLPNISGETLSDKSLIDGTMQRVSEGA